MLYPIIRVESVRDEDKGTNTSERKRKRKNKVTFILNHFQNYKYRYEYVIKMLKNYCYLNNGLTIVFNGENIFLKMG
jgi:topoisomerase-4 subunit B